MTSQPQERMTLLMLVFDDDPQAHAALQELKAMNKEKRIKIKATALVTKKLEGKVKIKPKVLALIEPLWIQDFIQALLQSPITSTARQMRIGLDLENAAHPLLYAETLQGELPPPGQGESEAPLPSRD
jgi:hypothetical protein